MASNVKMSKMNAPAKIGIGGAIANIGVGGIGNAALIAANDGNIKEIAQAALTGLADGVLPGVTDGFKNITENNQHQNRIDQALNAVTTATQGIAVGALGVAGGVAAAAPITAGALLAVVGGSLIVAGVAGIANIGLGAVHDVTYAAGASKHGGLLAGLNDMAGQFSASKASNRATDWMIGNNEKIEWELADKGIKYSQLKTIDIDHDGKISAQEIRDHLVKNNLDIAEVNTLGPKTLVNKLESVLSAQALAETETASKNAKKAGVTNTNISQAQYPGNPAPATAKPHIPQRQSP